MDYYPKICRMCLSNDSLQVSLFEDYGIKKQLASKIKFCLQIIVNKSDSHSKSICYACMNKLEMFYDFKLLSLGNEKRTLREKENVDPYENQINKINRSLAGNNKIEYATEWSQDSNSDCDAKWDVIKNENRFNKKTMMQSSGGISLQNKLNGMLYDSNRKPEKEMKQLKFGRGFENWKVKKRFTDLPQKIKSKDNLSRYTTSYPKSEHTASENHRQEHLPAATSSTTLQLNSGLRMRSILDGSSSVKENIRKNASITHASGVFDRNKNIIMNNRNGRKMSPLKMRPMNIKNDNCNNVFDVSKFVDDINSQNNDIWKCKDYKANKVSPKYSMDMFDSQLPAEDTGIDEVNENSSGHESEFRLTPDVNIIDKLRKKGNKLLL